MGQDVERSGSGTARVVAEAPVKARDHDPEPAVRRKAGWYAPGGAIHRRT
jgi:hypothetical protein